MSAAEVAASTDESPLPNVEGRPLASNDAYVAALAAAAPPLSESQRGRLALILRPTGGAR